MPRSNKSNPQNLDRNAYQALLDKLIPSQLFKKRKYPTNSFKEFRFVDTYRAHAEDKQIAPAFRVFFCTPRATCFISVFRHKYNCSSLDTFCIMQFVTLSFPSLFDLINIAFA